MKPYSILKDTFLNGKYYWFDNNTRTFSPPYDTEADAENAAKQAGKNLKVDFGTTVNP